MSWPSFAGRRAIKYLGQYKPLSPYSLSNGLIIVPADSGMVKHGQGGTVFANTSYVVSGDEMSDADLSANYRSWLAFDAFILQDNYPIWFHDAGNIGDLLTVPPDVPCGTEAKVDYKQIDYDNIAKEVLGSEEFVTVTAEPFSYERLFNIYLELTDRDRELIHWFVSVPHMAHSCLNPFFRVLQWQLFHAVVMLENLIDAPPTCDHGVQQCPKCNNQIQSHHSIIQSKWRPQFLRERIGNTTIADEYAEVIKAGFSVRHLIAHKAKSDQSNFPSYSPNERQEYDSDRATKEYAEDTVALNSLVISLQQIGRYLLLDRLFKTGYFAKLKPLKVICIAG